MGTVNQGSGAGEYRRRVSIQKPVQVQATTGNQDTESWVDVWKDVPCSIAAQGSREVFSAQQVQADITNVIKFRWRPNVDQTMRVLHYLDNKRKTFEVFSIEGIPMSDVTGRVEITLNCRKREAEGFRTDD